MDRFLRRVYAWACERLYHELAWGYDWVSDGVSAGRWDAWRRLALDEARRTGSATERPMLELGFGTGELLAAARQAALPLVGLELSPQMHAVADAKLTARTLTAPRVQATATAMPFHDNSFGAVISTFPAPYILESATLRECVRVLCDSGRLIIVGLWVVPVVAGHKVTLPLLYNAPSSEQIEGLAQRLERAGFITTVQMRTTANAEVGLLVGQKSPCVVHLSRCNNRTGKETR